MSDTLYRAYERELQFIRQMAREFGKQYPAAAGRLLLEADRCADPHIERMIESFALLAGRVQLKIDDDFPELTDALLSTLYPHYLAPVPSMAVVQFVADAARTPLADGFLLPRHSKLRTRPVNGLPCRYRTAYPVTLWPVVVTAARLQPPPFPADFRPPPGTAAVLRLTLECQGGMKFSDLSMDTLRLHLLGEGQLTASLHELLLNNALQAVIRSPDDTRVRSIHLSPKEALQPAGFEADEGLLPYPARSFPGYRLLTELFAYPAKFLFIDVCGLSRACKAIAGKRMEIAVFVGRTTQSLEQGIDATAFRTGCTPIVNLFEQTAEPIDLSHQRHEYRVTPLVSQQAGMEVYSIDEVTSADTTAGRTTVYEPFHSFRHGAGREERRAFWHATRRASMAEGDRGTDVFLNLVDLDFKPHLPAAPTLVVRTTCTNRDLAGHLQRAGDQLYLELEGVAPLAGIRCLRTPTLPLRPPRRRGAFWRLISHLNLNHLSISDPLEGRAALQEMLRLYDFSDPESGQQMAEVNRLLVEGITAVSSRRVVGRAGAGACRGVEVTVELDEEKYVGTGPYLFASVLERFMGMYAGINSFTQMVARTRQGEGLLKRWPPRAGEQVLP